MNADPTNPSTGRVTIEIDAGVADVRLVRADKHNALDWAMFAALNDAIDELAESNEARVVVLSGDGPSFCSGLDFPSFAGGEHGIDEMLENRDGEVANFAQRSAYGWRELPVPVIAVLHGACFGGGLQIALAADIRLAARDTRMSVMEMKYGLIPDMSLSQTLPRLVRDDVARELVYTARIVDAAEAAELGIVTRVSADPLSDARELAATIATMSPDAIRAAKRLLAQAWGSEVGPGLALEADLQRGLLAALATAT